MSTLKQLDDSIIEQCLDDDGLFMLLRYSNFSDDKYEKLRNTLTEYIQALGHQKLISRKVAGHLWAIEGQFYGAVFYHDREPVKSDVGRKIKDSHAEFLVLIDGIFDVNLGE